MVEIITHPAAAHNARELYAPFITGGGISQLTEGHMKETIYTIPINEVFDLYDGCPVCRLYGDLERASLEYILGAAMMEPDVRINTNKQGFCHTHLRKMLAEKNKLSLALMLESHLPELGASLFSPASGVAAKDADLKRVRKIAKEADRGCFVCDRVSVFMGHYYGNIFHLWRKEPDFHEKFNRQPFFCVPHFADLAAQSEKYLSKKEQAALIGEMSVICQAYLVSLNLGISEFCKSFDYRFAGKSVGERAQSSSERAAAFLTGARK